MTIEEFIEKLKNWNPITAFEDLMVPVQRNKKGEIKNPKVIGIVNIYSDSNEYIEYNIDVEHTDFEYVKYNEKNVDIEDNEWGKNAEVRRKNLQNYLLEMQRLNPSRLFVGEAPGRFGCFQTGIPFTDIHTFFHNPNFKRIKDKLNEKELNQLFTDSAPEDTSSATWKCLNQLHEKSIKLPLLWNIYPFYPWEYGKRYQNGNINRKNRNPVDIECKVGIEFIFDLLKCFNIKEIYSVGDIARETLEKMFPMIVHTLRHPANDVNGDFIKQFNKIYQIKTEEPEDSEE